jgi:hypothetical protein
MRTSLRVHHGAGIGYETLPAEVVAATMACHVVASALLLDVDAAFRTGLCAERLYGCNGGGVFEGGCGGAKRLDVPGAVAGETEGRATVWAGDLLRLCGRAGVAVGGLAAFGLGLGAASCGLVGLIIHTTVLDGEVLAAFRGQAGDEVGVRGQEVLRESGVVPGIVIIFISNFVELAILLFELLLIRERHLQLRMIQHMIAVWVRARQFCLAKLTALDLADDHLRNALTANVLEVLTDLFILADSE